MDDLAVLTRAAQRGDSGAAEQLALAQRELLRQQALSRAAAAQNARASAADNHINRIRAIRDEVASWDPPPYPYGERTAEATRHGPVWTGGLGGILNPKYAKTPEEWRRDARAAEYRKRVAGYVESMPGEDRRELVPPEARESLERAGDASAEYSVPLAPWSTAGRLMSLASAVPGYAIASAQGNRQQRDNAFDAAMLGVPSALRTLASPTGASRETAPAWMRAYRDSAEGRASTPFWEEKGLDAYVRSPERYVVPDGYTAASDMIDPAAFPLAHKVVPYVAGAMLDPFMPVTSYMKAPLRAAATDAVYGASTPALLQSLLTPSGNSVRRESNDAIFGEWSRGLVNR